MNLNGDPIQFHLKYIGNQGLVSPAMTDHWDEVEIPIEDDKDGPTTFRGEDTVRTSGKYIIP
jgi:hypothetical protein